MVRRPPRVARYAPALVSLVILVAVACLTRGLWIGDPLLDLDEQFYLLVADRMWHGDLPYVDIWDRKPIGLFLLYALFRPLSADGVVAYQVAASLFATATACVIVRIGRRLGGWRAATVAGVTYLAYLPIMGGLGGQSPVFYNLFTALAGLLIVRAKEAGPRATTRAAVGAMLLVGVAIQVKYTVLVDGIGFGLYLLWLRWQQDRHVGRLVTLAALMVACAVLPTALALGFYVARGYGWAFFQANFLSIFETHEPKGASNLGYLRESTVKMAPVVAIAAVSLGLALRTKSIRGVTLFTALWCLFAIGDFFLIGRFYTHYALPALVPLAILTVPFFESPVAAGATLAVLTLFIGQKLVIEAPATRAKTGQFVERMTAMLAPYTSSGCLYLKDGPPVLYLLTHSCLPTPYVFPENLSAALEAEATGASAAMTALLARRPPVITTSTLTAHAPNPETRAMLDAALKADYHLKAVIPQPDRYTAGAFFQTIYVRNDLR